MGTDDSEDKTVEVRKEMSKENRKLRDKIEELEDEETKLWADIEELRKEHTDICCEYDRDYANLRNRLEDERTNHEREVKKWRDEVMRLRSKYEG